MLSLNLRPIFKARGIERPFTFLMKAGVNRNSATSLLNNTHKSIKFKHIELLCRLLNCEPGDLFLWTPEKGEIYPENFPLSKLKKSESVGSINETLAKLSYKELKEVTNNFINKNKEEND